MCGRFTNEMTWAEIHALYNLSKEMYPTAPSNMQPRFNIAPTQDVDFVHLDWARNPELKPGTLVAGAILAWLDTGNQGKDAKAILLGSQIDSHLEFHRVGREVNNSRYEGTDTKMPMINAL